MHSKRKGKKGWSKEKAD